MSASGYKRKSEPCCRHVRSTLNSRHCSRHVRFRVVGVRFTPESRRGGHEAFILDLVDGQKDIALHEIAEKLAREQGLRTCPATIWYFLSKRGLTHKKRRAMPQSNSARMSAPAVKPGSTARSTSTRRV